MFGGKNPNSTAGKIENNGEIKRKQQTKEHKNLCGELQTKEKLESTRKKLHCLKNCYNYIKSLPHPNYKNTHSKLLYHSPLFLHSQTIEYKKGIELELAHSCLS